MKIRSVFYTLTCFIVLSVSSIYAEYAVNLVQERGDETTLRYTMESTDYTLTSIDNNGRVLELVYLPFAAYDEPKGNPHLPHVARSIIIPDRPKMSLSIIDASYFEVETNTIAPSKGSFSRQIDPATVPYEFGEVYSQQQWYPSQCATLGQPYIVRDFRANVVNFYPLQYNPVTNKLRVYTSITVKVVPTGETGINVKNRTKPIEICQNFHQIYSRRLLNYTSRRYTPVDEEGTMLIIAYPDFMAAMEPFVAWKNRRGLKTEMVSLADAGSTVSGITAYVKTYYTSKDLKYLLFVGDNQQVPTSASSGDPSDNKYACVEGTDSYVEFFVGRLSGTTAQHIQIQVEKVLLYERELGTADTWLNKGFGTYSSSEADDKKAIDHIKVDLEAFTYSSIGTQGGHQATLVSAINAGMGCHINSSHGSKTSIAGISVTSANTLTNNKKYPFNYTLACNPGTFNTGTDCLGEALLKKSGGGYIGAFMASISQPWYEPYAGIHEHTDILCEKYPTNIKRTYGGIAHNGCMKMIDGYPNQGPWVSDCWVLFGDPSLLVYTDAPKAITIKHPAAIGGGSQSVTITGTDGATVCLYSKKLGIQAVKTLASGTATMTVNITGTEKDSLLVTAYAFNYQTYQGTIIVNTNTGITVTENTSVTNLMQIGPVPAKTFLQISLKKKASVSAYKVRIYDPVGNILATTARLPSTQVFNWNLRNRNNRRATPGSYLAMVELFYNDGSRQQIKKVFGIQNRDD